VERHERAGEEIRSDSDEFRPEHVLTTSV
jgi:hypothetical protein